MYIVPTSAQTCPSIASLRRTKTQILNANKTFGIIGPCINHKYTCILYGKWIYGNTAPFKSKKINETLSVLAPYKIQIDAENIILSAITPFNKQINRIQLLKKGLEVYEHANYAICWYDWMLPVRKYEVDQYSKGIDCIISLSALLQLLSVIFSHWRDRTYWLLY